MIISLTCPAKCQLDSYCQDEQHNPFVFHIYKPLNLDDRLDFLSQSQVEESVRGRACVVLNERGRTGRLTQWTMQSECATGLVGLRPFFSLRVDGRWITCQGYSDGLPHSWILAPAKIVTNRERGTVAGHGTCATHSVDEYPAGLGDR